MRCVDHMCLIYILSFTSYQLQYKPEIADIKKSPTIKITALIMKCQLKYYLKNAMLQDKSSDVIN